MPDTVLPNLYLCDIFAAHEVLKPSYAGHGPVIKYILSILDCSVAQPQPKPVNSGLFVQKLIILDDTPDADLLSKLGEACDWIEDVLARSDGGVLVHCQQGISRSASMVIAYIMRKQELDHQKALDKVRYRRGLVRPNLGFQRQLRLWQEMDCNIYEPDPDAEGQLRKKAQYVKWKEDAKLRLQKLATL